RVGCGLCGARRLPGALPARAGVEPGAGAAVHPAAAAPVVRARLVVRVAVALLGRVRHVRSRRRGVPRARAGFRVRRARRGAPARPAASRPHALPPTALLCAEVGAPRPATPRPVTAARLTTRWCGCGRGTPRSPPRREWPE